MARSRMRISDDAFRDSENSEGFSRFSVNSYDDNEEISDDRAAEINRIFCRHIIAERKIPERKYRLLTALLSDKIVDTKQQEQELITLMRMEHVTQTIHHFVLTALTMTRTYTLSKYTTTPPNNLDRFTVYLTVNEDNRKIQYRTAISPTTEPHDLSQHLLSGEEYIELSAQIEQNDLENISNTLRKKLTQTLLDQYHLIDRDSSAYFSTPETNFLPILKDSICKLFQPDQFTQITHQEGLTEFAIETIKNAHEELKNLLHKTEDSASPAQEDENEVLEELTRHKEAIAKIESLEEIKTYLEGQGTELEKIIITQQAKTEMEVAAHAHNVRNVNVASDDLANAVTPIRKNLTIEEGISRDTIRRIKSNTGNQIKILKTNKDNQEREKKRSLATLLRQKKLSYDQIHLIAWLITQDVPVEKKDEKKVDLLLTMLTQSEAKALAKQESTPTWIKKIDHALLEVVDYVNEQIAQVHSRPSFASNSKAQEEEKKLCNKLSAIHQALTDIHEGKPVPEILTKLKNNDAIAEKRGLFRSTTLKKIKDVKLNPSPLPRIDISFDREPTKIQRLAAYAIELRKRNEERKNSQPIHYQEHQELAIALLEEVKSHIQAKRDSLFTIEKNTLDQRLEAIKAAIDNLTHEPDAKTILEKLETEDCIKKQRFWPFFKKTTSAQKSIAAVKTIICAPAA